MFIHYHRFGGDYENWELLVWEAGSQVSKAVRPRSNNDFGLIFSLNEPHFKANQQLEFHFKSSRDRDSLVRSEIFAEEKNIWILQGSAKIFTQRPEIKAYLTAPQQILIDFPIPISSDVLSKISITLEHNRNIRRNARANIIKQKLDIQDTSTESNQIILDLDRAISLSNGTKLRIKGFSLTALTEPPEAIAEPVPATIEVPSEVSTTDTANHTTAETEPALPTESPSGVMPQAEQGEPTLPTPQSPKTESTEASNTEATTTTMPTDKAEQKREIQVKTQKLFAELEKLQEQAKNLDTSLKTDSLDPDSNYIFAKEIIDNDISTLQSAYRGLQDLVIRIQSDQTKMDKRLQSEDEQLKKEITDNYNKLQDKRENLEKRLTDADGKNHTELSNKIAKVQTDLTNELKGVQSELTNNLNGVQSDLTNNVNGVQSDLTNTVNGVQSELTNRITGVESELTSNVTSVQERLNQAQTELTSSISGVQSELRDSVRNTENDVRNLQSNYDRLHSDLNSAQNKITENSRTAENLKAELAKLRSEHQELKASKEDSLRKLAQYVNRLAVLTGKDKELDRYNLNDAMKKLEGTGSAK